MTQKNFTEKVKLLNNHIRQSLVEQGFSSEIQQHMDLAATVEKNAQSKFVQIFPNNFIKCANNSQ